MVRNKEAEVYLAELGAFVHGMLAGFHLLGVMYNAKRRNWWDVLAHALAASYDIHAMHSHIEDVVELKVVEVVTGESGEVSL